MRTSPALSGAAGRFDCGFDALSRKGKQFDLIYVDPPYQSGLYETVVQQIADKRLLAQDGLILLECAKKMLPFSWRIVYSLYGKRKILWRYPYRLSQIQIT